MARPKKYNVDVMGDEPVEIKEYELDSPVQQKPEVPEMAEATFIEDKVTPLEQKIVVPKPQEPKEELPTPICDIEVLSESDKQVLVEKRIKAILEQSQIPYIPALVRYKEPESTAIPPMYALVDFDHRFVDEGWKFYQQNVRNPYVKDYLNLIQKLSKPNRIFPRLVVFNYE